MIYKDRYFVYIILVHRKDKKNPKLIKVSHYTGMTNSLRRRFEEHEKGRGAKYTKGAKKLILAHYEEYYHYKDAFMREKEIKRMSYKQKKELACLL